MRVVAAKPSRMVPRPATLRKFNPLWIGTAASHSVSWVWRQTERPSEGGLTIEARQQAEQATIETAKAYFDMEGHVCDLPNAAKLAMVVFDNKDLFLFAVDELDTMVQRFRANYYATIFRPRETRTEQLPCRPLNPGRLLHAYIGLADHINFRK